MLDLTDFTPLTIEDKSLFDELNAKYLVTHSDNLFTTVVSWGEYMDHRSVPMTDNIVILKKQESGGVQLRPPLGRKNPDLVLQVLELALRKGGDMPLKFIDQDTKEWMAKLFPNLIFSEDEANFDYVYLASDLAQLPGNAYAKIRNQLRKFQVNHPYRTEFISKENINDVQEFVERWCLHKDCESDEMLEDEIEAMEFSMEHFFELGLSGLGIRINKRIEAMSIFERMNEDTVVIHYEKGSFDFEGIYKAINNEVARKLSDRFRFINREGDLAIPGLRRAKSSYHPHHLTKVYLVEKNNIII